MSVVPELETIPFPEHYWHKLVDSKSTLEIVKIEPTGGFVAFIDRIACDWVEGSNPPATHMLHELIIDGVTRRFQYEIQINKPYVFDPPIVARNHIRWVTTNKDVPYTASDGEAKTGAHYIGVLIDGVWTRPKI